MQCDGLAPGTCLGAGFAGQYTGQNWAGGAGVVRGVRRGNLGCGGRTGGRLLKVAHPNRALSCPAMIGGTVRRT